MEPNIQNASCEIATAKDEDDQCAVDLDFTPEDARNYWTVTQRNCTTHIGYWRDWNWSQVQAPVFLQEPNLPPIVDETDVYDDDDDDDSDDHSIDEM